MSDPNCGCNHPSGSDSREYLMVKTTASEASTCGVPGVTAGTETCPKQEPTYDVSMSDFVMPSVGGTTPMEVCNASVYSLSTWLYFTVPSAALQITNITGNILTLSNKCPNGEAIDSNPTNVVISKGTAFVVGPEPQCNSDAEDAERINSALANATELCMPNMATAASTASIRPIGKIESDTADSSVRKCIKAIYGILFKAGAPYLTNLRNITNPVDINYRRLMKHETTNEVVSMANYSETSGLGSASHTLLINGSTERVVPTYFIHMEKIVLEENISASDPTTWPTLSSSSDFSKDFDVNVGNYGSLFSNRDHLYLMVRIDVGVFADTSGEKVIAILLNNARVGNVITNGDFTANQSSISLPVRINKSDYNLNLKLNTDHGGIRYHYRLYIDGAYY